MFVYVCIFNHSPFLSHSVCFCFLHQRCQTYEGGFGGVPGVEAHGGYTFCAFAALVMLKSAPKCNLKSLLVRIYIYIYITDIYFLVLYIYLIVLFKKYIYTRNSTGSLIVK